MKTREQILTEVLDLQREIDERQDQIDALAKEAVKIPDPEDDENEKLYRSSYLGSILSHATGY